MKCPCITRVNIKKRTKVWFDPADDGAVESFGYSARGLAAYTNQVNFVTRYAFDEAGRKIAETNANNETILYTNNAAGDLLSLTDGKGQTTRWNYDEYGQVTNKLDQAGAEILRYKYDPNGRLTNRWSAARGNTYYTYDPVGNLTGINYPSSTDVSFAYDWLDRLTNMVDASGTTKYTYTAGNQLLTEDGPFASDTVTNTYQNRLRTALALQQPAGAWTNSFAYDAAARLTNVTSPAGSFGYEYPGGAGGASGYCSALVKRLVLPNTSAITNDFDSVGRLLATHLRSSAGVLTNQHAYTYNPASQRTNETRFDGSTVAYTYDPIGQLRVADSSVAAEDRGYAYDGAWNLNYRTNNGVLGSFSVNVRNELTSSPGGGALYDSNGNLTISDGDTRHYAYDDENRLIEWTFSGVPDGGEEPIALNYSTFAYDGLGRMRARADYYWGAGQWNLSAAVRYVYDNKRVIQERNSANTPTVSYTRGSDLSGSLEGAGGIGGLLARSHGYSSGNWTAHSFYHADGNGNVTFMLNSSQALVARYRFDPFGRLISQSGSLATANVYRFSSKEYHSPSGLYYYLYRWYSPELQRWVNRDPIGERGGVNLFGFVRNDSISFVDPDGLRYGNPVPPCYPYPECISSRPRPVPPSPGPAPVLVPPVGPPRQPPIARPPVITRVLCRAPLVCIVVGVTYLCMETVYTDQPDVWKQNRDCHEECWNDYEHGYLKFYEYVECLRDCNRRFPLYPPPK